MKSPHRYPPSARLRDPRDFRRILSRGRVLPGREVLVRGLLNEVGGARLGISAPRRYGGAVERNRFRRLVREAFRLHRDQLDALDLLVSPRRLLGRPTLEGISQDLLAFLAAGRRGLGGREPA
jgi:ribonuclease P protein component